MTSSPPVILLHILWYAVTRCMSSLTDSEYCSRLHRYILNINVQNVSFSLVVAVKSALLHECGYYAVLFLFAFDERPALFKVFLILIVYV